MRRIGLQSWCALQSRKMGTATHSLAVVPSKQRTQAEANWLAVPDFSPSPSPVGTKNVAISCHQLPPALAWTAHKRLYIARTTRLNRKQGIGGTTPITTKNLSDLAARPPVEAEKSRFALARHRFSHATCRESEPRTQGSVKKPGTVSSPVAQAWAVVWPRPAAFF